MTPARTAVHEAPASMGPPRDRGGEKPAKTAKAEKAALQWGRLVIEAESRSTRSSGSRHS